MSRQRCCAGRHPDARMREQRSRPLASSHAGAGAPRCRPASPRAGRLPAGKTCISVLLAWAVLFTDTVAYASGAAQRSFLGEGGRATTLYRPASARPCRRAGFVPSPPPGLTARKAQTCSHRPGNAGTRSHYEALSLVRLPRQSLLMLQHGGDGNRDQKPLVPAPDVPTAIWSELKAHVLKRIMKRAVVHERYEQAARLKDELEALNSLLMQVLCSSSVLYATVSPAALTLLCTSWRAGARGQPQRPGFSDAQTSGSIRRGSAPDRPKVVCACMRTSH